jgi:hypothetical protein
MQPTLERLRTKIAPKYREDLMRVMMIQSMKEVVIPIVPLKAGVNLLEIRIEVDKDLGIMHNNYNFGM